MRKLVVLAVLLFSFSVPFFAFAQLNPDSTGLKKTGDQAYGPHEQNDLDAGYFVGEYIIKPVLGFTGVIFLMLMVYAGFLWMTSAGDSKRIDQAKKILVNSVIGVAIMVSAYAITNTVLNALTGTATASPAPEEPSPWDTDYSQ